MRFVVLAACATLAAAPASAAEQRLSTYSNLSLKVCPNDLKVPLSQVGDLQAITYRCGGPAGVRINIVFMGTYVDVQITGPGVDPSEAKRKPIRAEYAVGEKLEWRGTRANPAQAGILRLLRREGEKSAPAVLAVLARDKDRFCVAALIDPAAVPAANEVARRIADRDIEGFRCGEDEPAIIGPATARVLAARESNSR